MLNDQIRASDADRERVTARLQDHYAEGRLTREELDERVAAVLNAKTFGDMRWVMADLPGPKPVGPLTPDGPGGRGEPGGPGSSVPMAGGWYRPAFRRRPLVFPLLLLAVLLAIVIPGVAKLAFVALAIGAALVLVTLAGVAFAMTRFLHQVHRQWGLDRFGHQSRHWQSWNWPDSTGQRTRWGRP
jgi:hypothetical protein